MAGLRRCVRRVRVPGIGLGGDAGAVAAAAAAAAATLYAEHAGNSHGSAR